MSESFTNIFGIITHHNIEINKNIKKIVPYCDNLIVKKIVIHFTSRGDMCCRFFIVGKKITSYLDKQPMVNYAFHLYEYIHMTFV